MDIFNFLIASAQVIDEDTYVLNLIPMPHSSSSYTRSSKEMRIFLYLPMNMVLSFFFQAVTAYMRGDRAASCFVLCRYNM